MVKEAWSLIQAKMLASSIYMVNSPEYFKDPPKKLNFQPVYQGGFMLRQIIKVLKALNSNEAPWQISLGIIFGSILGLTPLFNLHNLDILFLALVINVNISMMIVSWAVFSLIAYALDPLFHQLGYSVLTSPSLEGFWTEFFSCPIFLLANLNNTIVMGSLIFSLVAAVPLFFLLNVLVVKYRDAYNAFIGKFPLLRFLKVLDLYGKHS